MQSLTLHGCRSKKLLYNTLICCSIGITVVWILVAALENVITFQAVRLRVHVDVCCSVLSNFTLCRQIYAYIYMCPLKKTLPGGCRMSCASELYRIHKFLQNCGALRLGITYPSV